MLAVAKEVTDLQRLHDLPEEDIDAPACLIELADGSPETAEPARMNAKGITDIVETNEVGELGKEQAHDVTPCGKATCLFVNTMLAGKLRNEMGWYKLAELGHHWQFGFGWFIIFHQADPKCDRPPATSKLPSLSDGCVFIY